MTVTVMIPARMASTRLPGKPLADICGRSMIEHVWRRAVESGAGDVIVAAAEQEIVDCITKAGGKAVLTSPDLASGSDRIFAAFEHFSCATRPESSIEIIINLQGDLPTLDPALITTVAEALKKSGADIATLAAPVNDEAEINNPNVVKAAFAGDESPGGRALYFSRSAIPHGVGKYWHHIGIYAYRYDALAKFIKLQPSTLEKREKLEQLRALEAGMSIYVATVDTVPLGVDTPEDLEKAREIIKTW